MSQNVNEIRQNITQMYAKLESMNHYELMGLEEETFDIKKLRQTYRQLAKQWHVDRYNNVGLEDEEKQQLQEIFAAINNANRVLSDPALREEYDLEREHDNAADVAAILNAESLYLRGRSMLQQGKYSGAQELLNEALSLNPDDVNIELHALYAEYLMQPKDSEGEVKGAHRERTQEIYEKLDSYYEEMEDVDWLFVFMGHLQLGLGKRGKANRLFREALLINPRNKEAARYKRLIQMQEERQKNKGFFDRLKEKFKR